jgi:hypothetical protein
MEGLRDGPLFLLANLKDFKRNIFRISSINPRSISKRRLETISKGDLGRGIEDFHIICSARVAGAHPNSIVASPFKPRPPQP